MGNDPGYTDFNNDLSYLFTCTQIKAEVAYMHILADTFSSGELGQLKAFSRENVNTLK